MNNFSVFPQQDKCYTIKSHQDKKNSQLHRSASSASAETINQDNISEEFLFVLSTVIF